MSIRIYRGDRTIDGAEVTVDGNVLDQRLDVKTYTDRGFEWSYEGDGPRQLALAILLEHLGDDTQAVTLCERFMARVVANFENEWEMSTSDLQIALDNIRSDA